MLYRIIIRVSLILYSPFCFSNAEDRSSIENNRLIKNLYKNETSGVNNFYLHSRRDDAGLMLNGRSTGRHNKEETDGLIMHAHPPYYSAGIGPYLEINEYITVSSYLGASYLSAIKGGDHSSKNTGRESQYGLMRGVNLFISMNEYTGIQMGYEHADFRERDRGMFNLGFSVGF